MIGTTIQKPVADQEQFRAAMSWCCDPANNARMMEYADRYEVVVKPEEPAEEPEVEPAADIPEVTIEERLDDIEARTTELEDALIEVAALLPD